MNIIFRLPLKSYNYAINSYNYSRYIILVTSVLLFIILLILLKCYNIIIFF